MDGNLARSHQLADVSTTVIPRYFLYSQTWLREVGIELRLSLDFVRLIELNRQNRASWPPLPPIFDPEFCTLSAETAYWFEGVDEFGDTVVTSAGRLFDHADRSLATDLRTLRVFYDHSDAQIAGGARVDVAAPAAERISGPALYSGAVWVRPDYRRHGFTKVLPRLTRAYALARWGTPRFWMLIEPSLDRIGVTRAYGSWQIDGRVRVHLPSLSHNSELLIASMTDTALLKDLASTLDYSSAGTSRCTEIPNTKTVPRELHGMRTRS